MIGLYGGFIDKFPAGAWMDRSLTPRSGQCHVPRYMRPLPERIEQGELDPTRVITHPLPLTEAARGYDVFKQQAEGCEKVVLTRDVPDTRSAARAGRGARLG
jgi:threonine dehydrogenase-like Zn-dependent dehydrogenase